MLHSGSIRSQWWDFANASYDMSRLQSSHLLAVYAASQVQIRS